MRIVLVGAQNTGKTTVARPIAETNGLDLVSGLSRRSPYAKTSLNKKSSAINQIYLIGAIAAHTMASPNMISDRSPLDSLAYTLYTQLEDEFYPPGEIELVYDDYVWLRSFCERVMQNYDHIIYFPAYDWPIESDGGVRDLDTKYRQDIDYIMKELLDHANVPYKIMPDIAATERIELVQKWLG